MFDLIRVDACPRCQRNLPHDPAPDEPREDCPVCCGRPVRCLVLWNATVEAWAEAWLNPDQYKTNLSQLVMATIKHATDAAIRVLGGPDAICGPLVKPKGKDA